MIYWVCQSDNNEQPPKATAHNLHYDNLYFLLFYYEKNNTASNRGVYELAHFQKWQHGSHARTMKTNWVEIARQLYCYDREGHKGNYNIPCMMEHKHHTRETQLIALSTCHEKTGTSILELSKMELRVDYNYFITFLYMETKKRKKEREVGEAITMLRDCIDFEKGIVIVIKKISQSGMSRRMKVYNHDCTRHLSYIVWTAIDCSCNDDGVLVSGCGMDMTFWLADCLTYRISNEDERKKMTGNGSWCLPWKVL